MQRVLSVRMLVAAADALFVQFRASDKNIQRLAHDEPIPEGWRVATVDDAQRNAACFSLVLRRGAWRRKPDKASLAGDFTVAASSSGDPSFSSLRIEKRKPPPDQCTCKVVVRFDEGEVLKRERVEHVVNRVRQVGWNYILIWKIVSNLLISSRMVSPSRVFCVRLGTTSLGQTSKTRLYSSFKGIFSDIFLCVIYVHIPNVLRSEWIRRRGSI